MTKVLISVQLVDCEVQDSKGKNELEAKVMGDYWSPKLAPYAPFRGPCMH